MVHVIEAWEARHASKLNEAVGRMTAPQDDPNLLRASLERIDRRLRIIGELAILMVSAGFAGIVSEVMFAAGFSEVAAALAGIAGFIAFGVVFRVRV